MPTNKALTDKEGNDSLPMNMDSLIHARHEPIVWVRLSLSPMSGSMRIMETLHCRIRGSRDYSEDVVRGGALAHHLQQEPLYIGKNTTHDPYGRILVFDMESNQMDVFFEGGPLDDGSVFKQPDGLEVETINGQPYVFVCEDYGVTSLVDIKQESWEAGTAYDER